MTFYIVLLIIVVITSSSNCGGDDPKINYEYGFFPDSVINLDGMNSSFDDYNMALPQIGWDLPILFSTNRFSSGIDFDFVTGHISFLFNQIDGSFVLNSEIIETPFFNYLESAANSDGNELGPNRMFNGRDGMEYLFYSSDKENGDLDIKYMSYYPTGGVQPPTESEEMDASVFNSSSDDGYLTFDWDVENAYITSNRNGNFDIMQISVANDVNFADWLRGTMATATATDSINSPANDKCPYIMDTIMIFTSDRPGGLGGYDLYVSKMTNGKWGSPKNMGPGINTEYNEYRPLISFVSGFTNNFLLFSSDRPGGKGGYDLYFTGVDDL